LEVLGEGRPHLTKLPPIDEFPGLDDEARVKAIANRDPQNKELILNTSFSSIYSFESKHRDFPLIFKDIMAFIT
jgi:hypothetical protein